MTIEKTTDLIGQASFFKEKVATLKKGDKASFSGMIGASSSAVIAALAKEFTNILVVTSSTGKADTLRAEIELFSGGRVSIFPAPDAASGEGLKPSKELIGARLAVLEKWRAKESMIVAAPVKAVMWKTSQRLESIRLSANQNIRLEKLIERLVDLGYERFDIVGERGEFSLRGGIVDIFPIDQDHPVRIEFAGDSVDSIRKFDTYSQRSIEKMNKAVILPALEKYELPVFEFLPKDTVIVLDEPVEVRRAADSLAEESKEYLQYLSVQEKAMIELATFLSAGEEAVFSAPQSYLAKPQGIPREALIVTRHAARLKEELPDADIVQGELRGGFVIEGQEIVSDRELFGEEIVPRKYKPAYREGVAEELLADLKAGDYVVHENYGVGIYQGMKDLKIEGAKQEYILIEYAEGDKLYVPPHMAGLVEKYVGGRESRPKLSRLGTREWLTTRNRVKQSVRDMTEELLEIYASREKAEGYAYLADDIWQKELEATFPYEETPDQLKAIINVKKDMESARPMDRLVCGDVGYGKTEVAIRAAAKAASAGKQVAVLAPTTILVEQHYNNFRQRFKNLPFVVEMLSRFRSPKEQKEVARGLAAGSVEIVIGTHRLLSKDIKFKDLGVLVIDEEQKFGVTHKEKFKKSKKNIDVLTLTATPIPRTLYFSLSGIREMSMITTPPVDRSPIRTYVLPFSEKVIREAILREIDRGGQVYFVHNYVETIEGIALKIRKLVPEARVTVGHGQMDEKKLERTMLEFMDRKFDVLVCTSIIESGLDITNVNTILIDQADRLGLSQLYQVRGRVGRSAVRAYAYLFYHPARSMSDQAVERLKAIQEFTALGSGYKLAMRDLEIRGAGNLLGAEQSGHIYEVGFDLYCELLEEAVKEARGEKIVPVREVEIDLKVEASIPSDYITDDRQRIALYRRMNLVTTPAKIEDLRKELVDRFGPIPPQLERLIQILKLKAKALGAGVRSVKEENKTIRIEWISGKVKLFEIGNRDKVKLALTGIAE